MKLSFQNFVEEVTMDTPAIDREIRNARDETLKLTAPFQAMWKVTLFDLPLGVASETLRFFGRRMQAHGEHLASLNTCRTVPEIIDANSHFVRSFVDEYGQETNKIMQDVRGTMDELRSNVGKAA
jgi:hypothetical protein